MREKERVTKQETVTGVRSDCLLVICKSSINTGKKTEEDIDKDEEKGR